MRFGKFKSRKLNIYPEGGGEGGWKGYLHSSWRPVEKGRISQLIKIQVKKNERKIRVEQNTTNQLNMTVFSIEVLFWPESPGGK